MPGGGGLTPLRRGFGQQPTPRPWGGGPLVGGLGLEVLCTLASMGPRDLGLAELGSIVEV